jgi:hypothetical protein
MNTHCPNCNVNGSLRKSHSKNIFEKIVNHSKLFGTYRCMNCNWRGFLRRKLRLRFSLLNFVKSVALLYIVYYIVTYILNNYTN